MVIQPEEIDTHNEVQVYERKNTMSKRAVNETALRIYFPRHIDTVDTTSTIQTNAATSTSPGNLYLATILSQTKATYSIGSLRFLSTHSPSIYTMNTSVYLV